MATFPGGERPSDIRLIREIRIFLASPSDVNDERRVVSDIISELNRTISPDLDVFIRLIPLGRHGSRCGENRSTSHS